MPTLLRRIVLGVVVALLGFTQFAWSQAQAPSEFHWVNMEKDEWTVGLVRKALQKEQFTAIREIGVLGDAALVFVANRKQPDAIPEKDEISVYTASLRTLFSQKLLTAYQVRPVGWSNFVPGHRPELATVFADCVDCDPSTFLTSFYFEGKSDTWQARWMAEQHGSSLLSKHVSSDYTTQQVYAMVADRDGRESLVTWIRYDYLNSKRFDDYVYQYDVDPASGLDRIQRINGKEIAATQLKLCQIDPAWGYLKYGQDSELCAALVPAKSRPARHITTTPPAQNQGRSRP